MARLLANYYSSRLHEKGVVLPCTFLFFNVFFLSTPCTWQSIPRTVLLDTKTGSNLLQWPVVEVENLRMSGKSFDGVALDRGSIVPLDVGKATQVNAMIEPE